MKAIETRYRGYRFRSRLEARWAVFFDALGTPWEYEAEGFVLEGGVRYLPDFRLGESLWLEVKPGSPSKDEIRKAELLAQASLLPVAIGIGQPMFGELMVYCWDMTDGGGGASWWDDGEWRAVKGEDLLCIGLNGHRSDRVFVDGDWSPTKVVAPLEATEISSTIARAADSARSARFEHGESGVTVPVHREPVAPVKPRATLHALLFAWQAVVDRIEKRGLHDTAQLLRDVDPVELTADGVVLLERDPFKPLTESQERALISHAPLAAWAVADMFQGTAGVRMKSPEANA